MKFSPSFFKVWLFWLVSFGFASSAQAGFQSLQDLGNSLSAGEPELLTADEAFGFAYQTNGKGELILNWKVAPKYYLYQHKIKLKVISGQATIKQFKLPKADTKFDKVFNKTLQVYHHDFTGHALLTGLSNKVTLQVDFQGCAEMGVCYPPMHKKIELTKAAFGVASNTTSLTGQATNKTASSATLSQSTPPVLSESDQITDTLKHASLWIILVTFFIFGLLLAFTPCVFPMIPILSSIIVGQGEAISTRKAFIMSVVYVLAMSVTYTLAGVLSGLFGGNLQAAFQNPWIIGSFSFIFVLLALSMFGFYELQLPSALQSKLTNISNKQKGGSLIGVAIMGFLSALIVGPCMAPPLAGALIYIGQSGDALLGGLALFVMSLGMGLPLILLGTSAGKLLPRAGAWMDNVKSVFGVVMLGIAIWMASRILPDAIILFAWAALFIASGIYLGAFNNVEEKSGWFKLFKSIALILFIWGTLMLVGLSTGNSNPLQPLKGLSTGYHQASTHLQFKRISTLSELESTLKSNPKVMLDFYADWCVSCKEMEAGTFMDAGVHNALKGVTLIQFDVTENNAQQKALMKKLEVLGPPSIMFYKNGIETRSQRVVGYQPPAEFIQHIQAGLH